MLPLWRASEDGEYPYDHSQHNHTQLQNSHEATGRSNGYRPQRASTMPMPSLQGISPSRSDPELDNNSNSEKSWLRSLSFNRSNTNTLNGDKEKYKFDPEKALPEVTSHRPLRPARNPPGTTLYDYFPILRIPKWIFRHIRRQAKPIPKAGSRNVFGRKRKTALVDSNVPLEITMYLSSYLSFCLKNGLLQPALATGMMNNISSLQDTLSNLERIRSTPLPFAYQAHLRMSLWLVLLLSSGASCRLLIFCFQDLSILFTGTSPRCMHVKRSFILISGQFQLYATFSYLVIPYVLLFLSCGCFTSQQCFSVELHSPLSYCLVSLRSDRKCMFS